MTDDDQQSLFGALPAMKPPSRIQQRLIRAAVEIEADDPAAILFQHPVFCQTGLPYRNPGDVVRIWMRKQGAARLEVEAGRAFSPGADEFVDVGLPFGAKPRLILVYLNAEALRTGSPEIEVEDSLTAFVKRLGFVWTGSIGSMLWKNRPLLMFLQHEGIRRRFLRHLRRSIGTSIALFA
jgi:hypothetical protein